MMNIPLDTNSQMKIFHLTQQERLNWILEQQITHTFVSAQHEQYISYSYMDSSISMYNCGMIEFIASILENNNALIYNISVK